MSWKTTSPVLLKEEKIGKSDFKDLSTMTGEKHQMMEIGNATEYITIIFHVSGELFQEDFSSPKMQLFAETGGAFDFLKEQEEISYKESDGEPL